MLKEPPDPHKEVSLYMENAHEMINVATLLRNNDSYPSAINRAYYAIFYAASALLVTQEMSRGKHSGVLSAFRQHFIKSDQIENEYSDIYGRLWDHRQISDYDMVLSIEDEQARADIDDAKKFVRRIEEWLQKEGWL